MPVQLLHSEALGSDSVPKQTIHKYLSWGEVNDIVEVTGWVQTSRFGKNVGFAHIVDGQGPGSIQAVIPADLCAVHKASLTLGASVRMRGTWVASKGSEQPHELLVSEVEIIGSCDPTEYPIQKKDTSFEHLRTIPHLRTRTAIFQSVFRIRSQVSWYIHQFFNARDFQWVHAPIITASDCEGAGEMFEVSSGEEPFFGTKTFLTVSGQLDVEAFAMAFTKVYTFGPTFRAEHSYTSRHAAEFWMIEPEIAFASLDDVMDLAEDFVSTVANMAVIRLEQDLRLLGEELGQDVLGKLDVASTATFDRITWHEAMEILQTATPAVPFVYPVGPDAVLHTEHERYLADIHFKGPVFVTHYPADQKAFYMRLDDGGKTVASFDLLLPGVGEVIGGSQREDRMDVLLARLDHFGLPRENYEAYLDLRRFGSTPHGGFGLGLERLLMWITGMENIRDVLPYPRTPGNVR
jgi:asparaginyl-tRNA synthetase